jgi:hypothetical protein
MIDIVKLLNGNVAIYDSTSGDFINSLSPDVVEIECNVNGTVKVIQDNANVEYFDPATVANTQILPAAAIPFSGDCAALAGLLSTDFFFVVSGGGGSQNLNNVLTVGNSAGGLDITDLNLLDFDTTTSSLAGEGQLVWNDTLGTLNLGLKGGNTTLNVGQQLITRVVNKTTPLVPLTKAGYEVVLVSGATGQRLSVRLAKADNDTNSAGTLGIVCENIAVNQEGFIVSDGPLTGINTTGSLQGETWADGDLLYLSPTTFGGITNVKPAAPFHEVRVGYVEYAHAVNGKIYVKIDNGYELNELHNVEINTGTLANNDILVYNNSTTTWQNKTVATALGYTPAQSEGWNIIVKSANQTVTGSTMTDDTELQFSVVAGGNYMIELTIATSGDSSTDDYKFDFALSTGLMNGSGIGLSRNASNAGTTTVITALNAIATNTTPVGQNGGTISTASGVISATANYAFYVNSNATFKFRFAANTGTTANARTWKGSILKYKRID